MGAANSATPQQKEAVGSIMDQMAKKKRPQQGGGLLGGVQEMAGKMAGQPRQAPPAQPKPMGGGLLGGSARLLSPFMKK